MQYSFFVAVRLQGGSPEFKWRRWARNHRSGQDFYLARWDKSCRHILRHFDVPNHHQSSKIEPDIRWRTRTRSTRLLSTALDTTHELSRPKNWVQILFTRSCDNGTLNRRKSNLVSSTQYGFGVMSSSLILIHTVRRIYCKIIDTKPAQNLSFTQCDVSWWL